MHHSHHYLDCPLNFSEWKSVTQEFKSKWNFPHVAVAVELCGHAGSA